MVKKEVFETAIEALRRQYDYDKSMSELMAQYSGADAEDMLYNNGILADALLLILYDGMTNISVAEDMIGFYCWELDFGRKYKDGCFSIHGNNVDLSNAGKLYDAILMLNHDNFK